MKLRPFAAVLAATAVAFAPWSSAAPAPQVTDVPNDANFTATVLVGGRATPVGNQAYADVLSAQWKPFKKGKKVIGFTVTLTLAAPPTPPAGTSLVYRMLGTPARCGFFGVVYYTTQNSDKTIPQSAVRDNCKDATTRLTKIPLPTISGKTLTWNVPFTVIPKDTKIGLGTKLMSLRATVHEIQDFRGVCVPDDDGLTGYGKACGLGTGLVDDALTDKTYILGK